MPIDPSDLLPVQRGGAQYKATQAEVLGARLGIDAAEINDWDLALANGWYRSATGAANAPGAVEAYAGFVENYNDAFVTQTAHEIAFAGPVDTRTYRRHRQNSIWSPWYRLRLSQAEQAALITSQLSGYLPLSGGTVTGPVLSSGVRGGWAFGTDGANASGLYVDATGQPVLALRDGTGKISFQVEGNTGDVIVKGSVVSEGLGAWAFLAKNPGVPSAGGIYAEPDGSFNLALTDSAGVTTFQVNSQVGDLLVAGYLRSLQLAGAGPSLVGVDDNGSIVRYNPAASETAAGLMRFATDAEVSARAPGVAIQPSQIASITGAYLPLAGGTVTGEVISNGPNGAWAFATGGLGASGLYVDATGQPVLALRDGTGAITFQVEGNTGDAICWGDVIAKKKVVSEGLNDWAFLAKNPGVLSAGGIFAKADGSFDLLLSDSAGATTFQVDSQAGNQLVAGYLRSLQLSGVGPSFVGVDDNGTLLRWNPTSSETFAGLLRLATDAEVAARTPGLAVQPQQLGAALGGYLPLSGGTVTGAIFDTTANGWVFCGESDPGVNSSGLYATGDGNYLLGLRSSAGDVTVNLDSKLGTVTALGLLTQAFFSSGANTMAALSGAGNDLVGVDSGGNLFRQARADFVARAGDVMTGSLSNTVASGWVFNAASNPGVNDSGLFAKGDGNVLLGMRNASGQLTVDIDSTSGSALLSGPVTALAFGVPAPAGSALAGEWVIDASADRLRVFERGGVFRGFHADIKRLRAGANDHVVVEDQGSWGIVSHGVDFSVLPYLP